jgi:putative membrane protein
MMVNDHEEDISKFQKAADNAKDAELKAFADKMLPVLQKHHAAIKAIHDGMKK